MNRKKLRRYILTINNPFFSSEDFEEIDIDKTSLTLRLDYLKNEGLKSQSIIDCFDFKFIKWKIDNEDCVIERPFFKDLDSIEKYISNLEHIKYAIFQIEKGESETEHIQAFISFTIGKRFNTIKTYFPTAHIEEVRGSNVQARDYCSKEDTRVVGPIEIGNFAEERSRTDVKNFVELLRANVDSEELMNLYPNLYLREFNKITALKNELIFSEFKNKLRDVDITYIYGPPRTGKSRYIMEKYGLGNYYSVDNYGYTAFDEYIGEDVVVFDEYDSQIDITYMNKLLDRYPVKLRARYGNKQACYTKVYIVSNLPLSEQYKETQLLSAVKYKAFISRIHNIIKFKADGSYSVINKKKDSNDLQSNIIYDDKELKEIDELFC